MFKLIRRILLVLVLLILVLVVVGAVVAWDITRGPLPTHSGQLNAAGLNDSVTIIRDAEGIPHIYASTPHDLFFAQGFTQAQDRWWQMEFFRRTGNGQIQQLTGQTDSLMGTDIFIRSVGWRRAAERELAMLPDDVIETIQSFADGVNAYIGNRAPGDLALEYGVLSLTGVNIPIEPWTVADTLVWAKVMQWDLGNNYDTEGFRQSLYEALGQDLTDEWLRPWPFGSFPTIVNEDEVAAMETLSGAEVSQAAQAPSLAQSVPSDRSLVAAGNLALSSRFIFGEGDGLGSNNWVISGELTASGRPILANDPHLGIQMPSIWYEIGLHCAPVTDACPYDVVGFTFSPNPGVIIGHNGRIAWGVTNVGPDTQDTVLLEINPENALQYRWNGEWRDMTVYDETIRFGDGVTPMTIQVRETHLGPIINDNRIDPDTGEILGFNNENPAVLRWTALQGSELFRSVLMINQAQNWDEFRAALEHWDSPAQNFVYADVDGNIGYQTPGRLPIRAVGELGLTPSTCAEDACDWQGFIPFEYLPTVFNPEKGYIATANQAVVPLSYYERLAAVLGGEPEQYYLGQDWDIGYRGARITEMIEMSSQHTFETVAAIHGDNKLLAAESLALTVRGVQITDSAVREARDWMLEWDYQLYMDSPRAALWMMFLYHLTDNLFNDQLNLADGARSSGSAYEMYALTQLVNEPNSLWWDDVTTDAAETRDDILARSMSEAYYALRTEQGGEREAWRWGALHTATFVSNPLGLSGIDLIEGMVNRGPVMTSGGSPAVNATGWGFGRGDFTLRSLPSMRMIVDVGAFENSQTINTTGQSGHPFSPQYDNMIDRWRMIQYHPMLWTREQVEAAAVATLTLQPG